MLPRSLIAAMFAILSMTGLVACSGDQDIATASASDAGPGVRVVDARAAAAMVEADDRVIIDVRTAEEFAEGHLDGATLIDVSQSDFESRVAALDPDAAYLIYCRSGNRSAGARAIMNDLGFVDVADIDGGITAWVDAGYPTVS